MPRSSPSCSSAWRPAAAALQFEDAARLRDQLRELQEIRAQQLATARRTRRHRCRSRSPASPAVCDLRAAGARGPESRHRQPLSGQRAQRAGRDAGGFSAAVLQPRAAPPEVLINIELPDREALGEALASAVGPPGRSCACRSAVRACAGCELALENAHNALRMRALQAELAAEGRAGTRARARTASAAGARRMLRCEPYRR